MAISKTLIGGPSRDTANNPTLAVTLGAAITADTPCVAFYFAHATAPPDTCTASGGGVTWTKRATDQRGNLRVTVFTADGVASPSGTTITFDNGSGAGTANDAFIYEIAGSGDPVDWAYAVNNAAAAGNVTATLAGAPGTTDYGLVTAGFLDNSGALTWTGSFAEDTDGTHATPTCCTGVASDDGPSPPTAVTATYSGTAANCVIAYVDINEGVAPPDPPAGTGDTDDFLRSVSNGIGVSTFAGTYDLSGTSSKFSVTNGIATVTRTTSGSTVFGLYPGQSESGYDPPNPDGDIELLNMDTVIAFRLPVMATTSGADIGILHHLRCQRDIDQDGGIPNPTDDFYFIRVTSVVADNSWEYELSKLVANSPTTIASGSVGTTPVADEWWWFRAQTVGTGPTTLRFKLWKYVDSEPGTWFASTTDSESSLQNAGGWATSLESATGVGVEIDYAALTITEVSTGGVSVLLLGGL